MQVYWIIIHGSSFSSLCTWEILCCLVKIWFLIQIVVEWNFRRKKSIACSLSRNDLVCYASIIPDISSLMFIWFMGGKHWTMEVSLIAPFLSLRRCFNSSFPYITSFENPPSLVEPVLKEFKFHFWKRSHRFIRSRLFVRSSWRFKDPNWGGFSSLR